jgi:DNA mismatch repair protein MutS2
VSGQTVRRALRLGDKVRLPALNIQGVLTSMGEEEAEVQVGMLRIRSRLAELVLAGGEGSQQPGAADGRLPTARDLARPSKPRFLESYAPESPGIELDLRGQRADDALDALERYLDSAYLAGLPWVRIIHGKGTGKLRLAVREALNQHPHVKSFESGGDKEGGDGVTVAKLAEH